MKTVIYSPGMEKQAAESVVAIGVFDGVHLAHRELLGCAKNEAKARGIPLFVFTFTSETPTAKAALPLYGTEEKCRLLEACGADGVLLSPFPLVASLRAEDFVREILIGVLGCRLAVCGFNFRFGANAAADAERLSALMAAHGGAALTVPPFLWRGEVLSSTRIRELLAAGDPESAGAALGERYRLTGKVEHGLHLGSRIGIPTLNLSLGGLFPPKPGVYAAYCEIGGERTEALVNVGVCPTFGARTLHAEAHLFRDVPDCYGEEAVLFLVSYLREEKTFGSAAALLAQIEKDKETARSML